MRCRSMASATAAFATLSVLTLPSLAVAQDKGVLAFNNTCRTCHSIKAGENRLGPSLNGVVGRKAGSLPGYGSYSQGMLSSGITWDEATLEKFISNPEAVVPNNNMKPFKGVTDPEVRKQIIEYLKAKGAGAPGA